MSGAQLGDDGLESGLPEAPYPGLRPFAKDEWQVFFGRESMSQDVITLLSEKGMVAVHGDSGCGKSSLIAASVLPILEHDQARTGGKWRTCIMRPEDAPLANLAKALASLDGHDDDADAVTAIRRILNRGSDAPALLAAHLGCSQEHNVCILFDQFEELFEQARRDGGIEAQLVTAFLGGLVKARPAGLYAILTMRSDYLGQCAQYRGFAETVNATQYLVPRMERPALMRAIREPAALFGGNVSQALAERLIDDAGGGQDQLPLIQHGLMLLWRGKIAGRLASEPWVLTLDDYRQSGSLSDALSAHADAVLAKAAPDEDGMRLAEMVFRALADQNADGLAIRRRVRFDDLCALTGVAPEKVQAFLARFRAGDASFLRPYGNAPLGPDDRVDVSHEAFLRNWKRIDAREQGDARENGWLARETADGLQWMALRLSAAKYAGDQGKLLSPASAQEAAGYLAQRNAAWAQRYGGDWDSVKALVLASRKAAARQKRRGLLVTWSAIAAALVLAVLSAFAFQQTGNARRAEAAAIAEKERADEAAKKAESAAQAGLLNETISLAAPSRAALLEGRAADAVKLALAAWPRNGDVTTA